jgi:hypothetical protein
MQASDTGTLADVLEGGGAGFIWMEWHPRGHVLLAGDEQGCVFMW